MKTNCLFSPAGALAALTIGLLLATWSPATAQTYNGQMKLTEAPNQLEAAVFPVSNRTTTISVIFNNRTRDRVHIIIRNTEGKIFHEEFEYAVLYRRYFNLSELPTGNYVVELSKQREQFVRTFAISPPTGSLVTMDTPTRQDNPDLPDSTGKRISLN